MKSSKKSKPANFVYIYLKDSKRKLLKKVLVYQSLALFKDCVREVFSLSVRQNPVLTILTEDGKIINSTSELENAKTYVASFVDTDFERKMNQPFPAPGTPEAKRKKPFLFTNPLTNVNFAELLDQLTEKDEDGNPIPPPPKKKKVVRKEFVDENEPEEVVEDVPMPRKTRLVADQAIAIASFRKKNSQKTSQPFKFGVKYPTNQSTKIDMRLISRAPTPSSSSESESSSSNDQDDADSSPPMSPRSTSSRDPKTSRSARTTKIAKSFLTKIVDSSDSDEDSPESIKKKEARAIAKRQQELFDSQSPFEQMMGEFIQPENVPKCYPEALAQLPPDRQHFISKASDMEGEQMYLWIRTASQQPFLKRQPLQPYHDPTTMQAAEFYAKHRAVVNGFATYRFKAAITGPRRSGKTTVFASFVDQYFAELAIAGVFKSTFVLVLDMKFFQSVIDSPRDLYRAMVNLVLDALVHQKPMIQVDIAKIRNQFLSVTEGSRVLIPKHDYPELNCIAKRLNQVYRDPDAFEVWLTNIFLLPVFIPKAVGFKTITIFIDNIEYGDCIVEARDPFRLNHNVFIIEHLKFALLQTNYMVTSEETDRLFQVLSPVDEGGIDLLAGIDFISTMDVTEDIGSRAHFKYVIDIQEEPEPIEVYARMCAGCVAFLILWDELNLTIFRLDRLDPKSDQYLESYYGAVAQAQKLVDSIFICEGSKKITVCGVRRKSILKNKQADDDDPLEGYEL